MKTKKISLRSCVITHEKCEKKDLLRVVKNKDGDIFIDDSLKANGKGAYIKKDKDVIEKCIKGKVLNKVFEMNIPDSLYEDLKKYI